MDGWVAAVLTGTVIKGAGDALRGEINSFIDNVGEGIAGRSKDERPPTVTDGGRRPEEVAKEGEARLEKGLNGLDRQ